MKIKDQKYNNVTVLELEGELETDFVDMFERKITETIGAQARGVVLDMDKVGFIDSHGLEMMLWARDYCNDNRCGFRLAGLDENCGKILEITRLNEEFDLYEELSEAVKSFA